MRTLCRSAAYFSSMTASQKEATASHSSRPGPWHEPGPDALDEDPAVSFPCRALLDCEVHRVLETVRTVVTPGRHLRTYSIFPKTTVSGEDLRHAVNEGAVTPPEPLFKEVPTMVACPNPVPLSSTGVRLTGF